MRLYGFCRRALAVVRATCARLLALASSTPCCGRWPRPPVATVCLVPCRRRGAGRPVRGAVA